MEPKDDDESPATPPSSVSPDLATPDLVLGRDPERVVGDRGDERHPGRAAGRRRPGGLPGDHAAGRHGRGRPR